MELFLLSFCHQQRERRSSSSWQQFPESVLPTYSTINRFFLLIIQNIRYYGNKDGSVQKNIAKYDAWVMKIS